MVSDHCCTNAATRMVEAHGCPGMATKAWRGGPKRKAHGATIAGGQAPMKEAPCRKAWMVRTQGLSKPDLE